jgi:uncharacterized membrane protein YkoI
MLATLRSAVFGVAAATAITVAGAAMADPDDHERAHRAVERGEMKSLADILAIVRDKLPGEVAGVEIEQEDGHWVYEFRVVDSKGRLFDVYVDARSGAIERTKEK